MSSNNVLACGQEQYADKAPPLSIRSKGGTIPLIRSYGRGIISNTSREQRKSWEEYHLLTLSFNLLVIRSHLNLFSHPPTLPSTWRGTLRVPDPSGQIYPSLVKSRTTDAATSQVTCASSTLSMMSVYVGTNMERFHPPPTLRF